jgi:hypothetical protein
LMYVVVAAFAVMIKIGGAAIVANKAGAPSGVNGLDTVGLFTQLQSGNGLWSIIVVYTVLTIVLLIIGAAAFFVGAIGTPAAVVSAIGLPAALVTIPLSIGGVVILILAVIILFVILKLFWLMAKTAAITVLLIIVGPLMILLEALGIGGGFWGWIKVLLANLSVYPTVIIMIFLSHYFFWGWFLGGSPIASLFPTFNTFGINWQTTPNGVVNLPGMPIATWVLGLILAFVTLFLIPKASEVVQGLIEGKGFNVAGGIKEAASPVTGPAGAYFEGHAKKNAGTRAGTVAAILASLMR